MGGSCLFVKGVPRSHLGAEGAPALASLEVPVEVRRLEVGHVPRALLVVLLFHLRRMEG